MTDIDLSRLPTGARSWAALVTWAATSDDREERYFLELKSDVDLTAKHGRHKVAKFILGAANRDPAKAAKRLGGHAVMLLGVSKGVTAGIAPFEAQDLEREVRKFTGASGPGWDFERIPLDGDNDVIAIVVDPPTATIWPCLADGEGMTNGDIYLRGDGRTEKATGGEIQAMLSRAAAAVEPLGLPEVTVEIVGEVLAVEYDSERITAAVQKMAADYSDSVREPTSPVLYGVGASSMMLDRRSKADFRRQVERWKSATLADPASALLEGAAGAAASFRLRITNPVAVSLRDMRIELEFDDAVRALDWENPEEQLELFPGKPLPWGRDSVVASLASMNVRPSAVRDMDGVVRIMRSSPAKLSLSLKLLHPMDDRLTEDKDIVLVLFVQGEPPQQISAKWRLTAGDVNDIREGTVMAAVVHRDWTRVV
ncbi:hypothetical protein KXS11_12615 [Plantibacter flavus]|uniref:hypothetical protein n=1 Tax=Plantibacter flavus TaxID=150123 RepID=UPI003F1407C8